MKQGNDRMRAMCIVINACGVRQVIGPVSWRTGSLRYKQKGPRAPLISDKS
jgi:hypothetical protein